MSTPGWSRQDEADARGDWLMHDRLKPPVWRCRQCEWEGETPSISDASEVRDDDSLDRVHIAVCVKCFTPVRRIK
jgi:hypothetical protein